MYRPSHHDIVIAPSTPRAIDPLLLYLLLLLLLPLPPPMATLKSSPSIDKMKIFL
jgi:hypothetical protein